MSIQNTNTIRSEFVTLLEENTNTAYFKFINLFEPTTAYMFFCSFCNFVLVFYLFSLLLVLS